VKQEVVNTDKHPDDSSDAVEKTRISAEQSSSCNNRTRVCCGHALAQGTDVRLKTTYPAHKLKHYQWIPQYMQLLRFFFLTWF